MKGVVFTEFLEMVEQQFGYEVVDQIIESSDLASNGVYTAVGTYQAQEMGQLLTHLHLRTQIPAPVLLHQFGKHLFSVFSRSYGHFLQEVSGAFEFLNSIEHRIHVEVRKLYPDAELPQFITRTIGADVLEMEYISDRKMADLAEGLIEATMEHFEEPFTLVRKPLSADGRRELFVIQRLGKHD